MAAWNQVGLLLGGGLFAGIGLLLLGNRIYWRISAQRVDATIIGVRQVERYYYPVYRYTAPSGDAIESTSDVGTNSTRGMRTGRPIKLMVFEDDPRRASDASSYLVEILATVCAALGIGLTYYAFTAWPVTRVTWLVLVVMLIWAAFHLRSRWRAKNQRPGMAAWKAHRRQKLESTPLLQVEEFASTSAVSGERRVSPFVPPILALAGIAVLALSVYLGHNMYRLQATGQRAAGKVLRLEQQSDSDHKVIYYPVVRFSTPNGAEVEFKDRVGSNPPSRHAGDAVNVLYIPDSPKSSAIIDRRMWNWLPALALFLFGSVLTVAGIQLRRRAEWPPPWQAPTQ